MKRALCVGINDYPGTSLDLLGAVYDADQWATTLTSREFAVTTLYNKQATRGKWLKAMTQLVASTKAGDLAVIVFAGHGSWLPDLDGDEEDGRDEGWCPSDLERGLITDDDLHKLLDSNKLPGAKVVVISDCCHSGSVTRSGVVPATGGCRPRFLPPMQLPQMQRLMAQEGGQHLLRKAQQKPTDVRPYSSVLLLSACRDDQYAYDVQSDNPPHGVFSKVALEKLTELPTTASYRDWMTLIQRELPSYLYAQNPQLLGPRYAQQWKVFE